MATCILLIMDLDSNEGENRAFLHATAATAVAHLSHRNSVHLSVCHTGGSVKNGAS